MNERLRDLMLEAGYAAPELAGRARKLAELIVKDCATIVEGFTLEQEVALDQYHEYEADAVLKDYFGVEL